VTEDALTRLIIGAAIEVHRALGPGLHESAYQACLEHELVSQGLRIETEKPLRVAYKGVALDCAYRLDLLVENRVVAEIKTVSRIEPVHEAQVISYLELSGCRYGLLINFHAPQLIHGVRRFVNGPPEPSRSHAEETTEQPQRTQRTQSRSL
jgi:GxxExxY protein